MKLLYFAWVRHKIGTGAENLAADNIETVSALIDVLRARGGGYAEAFKDPTKLRCAVNREHANFSAKLYAGDEVAFFPPITGG